MKSTKEFFGLLFIKIEIIVNKIQNNLLERKYRKLLKIYERTLEQAKKGGSGDV